MNLESTDYAKLFLAMAIFTDDQLYLSDDNLYTMDLDPHKAENRYGLFYKTWAAQTVLDVYANLYNRISILERQRDSK